MRIFGKKEQDIKEVAKQQCREIKKNERDIERERMALQREEKQLVIDIKKAAKEGQEKIVKTLAKQLVRVREQQSRMISIKGQVQGIRNSMTIAASQQKMVQSMAGMSKAMDKMNSQVNIQQMNKVLQDFQRESEVADAKQDMLDDALDSMFDEDGYLKPSHDPHSSHAIPAFFSLHFFHYPTCVSAPASQGPFLSFEEEADSLTQQVLDEIGIDFAAKVAIPSRGSLPTRAQEKVNDKDALDDLESRLAALKS